jgi:BlaI family transcriptional regulator, penicillinase repressor
LYLEGVNVSSKPALSKGELEVARVLWELGEATPRGVFEAYTNRRGVDFATVQTYLRRLEAKGYLRARREGKTKYYSPRVRPTQVIRQTVDDFLDRLFDGETLPLVRYLIRDRGVTQEEIDELRRLLDQWEDKPDDSDSDER